MKKIFYLISVLSLLFMTNSCKDDKKTLFDFGGKNYASFDAAKISINASSEGKFVVYLYHMTEGNTASTYTISVDCGGAESLFTVSPTQISFDKDNQKAPIEIRYDMAKFELFQPYTVTLSIPNQETSGGIAIEKQQIVFTLQPQWVFYAEGVFESDAFEESWSQSIYKGLGVESLGIEVYRLPSLYTAGKDFVFVIDVKTGEMSLPGVEPNEDDFYRWETGLSYWVWFDPDPDWSWFDKDNKNAMFSFNFRSASGANLGWYDEYFDWADREPVFDYSADIDFTGCFTNPAGKTFALADVTLGEDVAYAKVALVPGEWDDAIIDGIIDESIESEEIKTGGSISKPCSVQGVYTYVVVTFNEEDEAKEVAYVTFIFPPVDVNIENFYGDYILTGSWIYGAWTGDMPVTIEEGDEPNTLTITGIDFVESLSATFDPVSGTMSIAPQDIADYYDDYYDVDLTNAVLLTFLPNDDVSETAVMTFRRMANGVLQLAPSSEAIGYIIFGEDEDGEFLDSDGYYYPVFTPESLSTSKKSTSFKPKIKNRTRDLSKVPVVVNEEESVKKGSFSIKRKIFPKRETRKNMGATLIR